MSWYTGNISYGTLLDLIPPPSLEAPAAAPFLFLPPYPVPAVIELGSGEVLVGLWSQLSQHLAPPPMYAALAGVRGIPSIRWRPLEATTPTLQMGFQEAGDSVLCGTMSRLPPLDSNTSVAPGQARYPPPGRITPPLVKQVRKRASEGGATSNCVKKLLSQVGQYVA